MRLQKERVNSGVPRFEQPAFWTARIVSLTVQTGKTDESGILFATDQMCLRDDDEHSTVWLLISARRTCRK